MKNLINSLEHLKRNLDVFACPRCRADIVLAGGSIRCTGCGASFREDEGIPLMFVPNKWDGKEDVTEIIKAFYEKTPFPNYESFETAADLIVKAERSQFVRMLNEQIPFGVRMLEVGCGTGQMTNYLGIANRSLFGADMCLNSLKLATEFKVRNNLERVGFYQMNLFRPIFKDESFHLVISNGVLHHTSRPQEGFLSIARLVKKGGYILIGLYHKWGRLITNVRQKIFTVSGDRFRFLDPRLRDERIGEIKKSTWFRDQYKNPHESKHAIGEILGWFDRAGFDFVYGIPNPKVGTAFSPDDKIFSIYKSGTKLDHFLVELMMVFQSSREGGFFVMIGKRR
ncbi:MAG: methyltransferase domain-containing protein [Patescibacteria group bacterium]